MNLTLEQQLIVDETAKTDLAGNPANPLIKCNAVAGAGKTTLLVQIAKVINPKNGLYLAYNKAISVEAGRKFPPSITCKSTHSLAYQNTVGPLKLRIGFFNYRDITERIKFEEKVQVMDTMDSWCLCADTKFDKFKTNTQAVNPNVSDKIFTIVKKYYQNMISGHKQGSPNYQPVTHAAYLKLYHLMLFNEKIKHKEFDLLMLDEAGDLNPVTLEIFKLLPSKRKLMVGDQHQNLYGFNGTINGFEEMRDTGLQLDMTQSFRCSEAIANRVQNFCKTYIDPKMVFKGVENPSEPDDTEFIISRTNSALIGKMIELNARKVKYNLTRPAKAIFELVLILINLKPSGTIYSSEWKFIQKEVDAWAMDPNKKMKYATARKLIANEHGHEPAIKSALAILQKYSPSQIYGAYESAKAHEAEKGHKVTLSTGHSLKGLEASTVTICNDLNESIQKVIEENGTDISMYSKSQKETMMLGYVAYTRAINVLNNAPHAEIYIDKKGI